MPLRGVWKSVLRLLKLFFFSSLPLIAVVWYLGRAEAREQNILWALLTSCLPVTKGCWSWYICSGFDTLLHPGCFVVPFIFLLVLWTPSSAPLRSDARFHSWGIHDVQRRARGGFCVTVQRVEGSLYVQENPCKVNLQALSFVPVGEVRPVSVLQRVSYKKRTGLAGEAMHLRRWAK